MRTGLISDTHLEDPTVQFDASIARAFAGVDLILRDIHGTFVLDRLEAIALELGIRAYQDPHDPQLEKQRVEVTAGRASAQTVRLADVGGV